MAIVTFVPAAFKTAFPEFVTVADSRLQILFGMVTATMLDNTDASPVVNIDTRSAMLWLLVAHMLTLFGTGVDANGGGSGGTAPVGRLSSATEGTVSSSFAFDVPQSPGAAWYNQTQYGAAYWMMMAPWRTFRYIALGQSGAGHSIDFLNGRRINQHRGPNDGTPGGL